MALYLVLYEFTTGSEESRFFLKQLYEKNRKFRVMARISLM